MTDHFTLDVDVESLRLAKEKLGHLAEGCTSAGSTISAAPGELGGWSGPASVKIKEEMGELGTDVTGFSTKFGDARDAVAGFITQVETFQEGPLATANSQWTEANENATEQREQAATDFADDQAKLGQRRGEIADGLRWTLQSISYTYGEERDALAQQAADLGTALAGLTTVSVPESVATDFVAGGGSGTRLSWTTSDGRAFPPDLDANATLSGTSLSEDADQAEAGANAAQQVTGSMDPDDVQSLLDSLNGEDEAFRQAFLENLDPDQMYQLQRYANLMSDDENRQLYGELVTEIAEIMAQGSNDELQPNYPVPSSTFDALIDAYVGHEHDFVNEEGYLMLAELVAAGQGDSDTWDSDLIADITGRTLEYEQQRLEEDPLFSWSDSARNMVWATEAGNGFFGHAPGQGDPIVLLTDALGQDPDAAQQVLSSNGSLDPETLHYLFERTAGGTYLSRNAALGEMLTAATSPVGVGDAGSPEYLSAEIVSELVDYWAGQGSDGPGFEGFEDAMADILTTHVHAVNHAGQGYEGAVSGNNPNGTLPYQQIALANLSSEDLQTVLQMTFGLDYWSNHVAQENGAGGSDFPRYTQLALAMELAARDDVILASQSGQNGLLERVVNDISRNQELANNAFVDALVGQGAERDQANADARAGLDFVLGIAKGQVPTGSGVTSSLAGAGLDQIKSLLVDTIIPESQYEESAVSDGELQSYRRELTSLKLIQWLEQAGTLPQEHSPQQWAEDNPDRANFLDDEGRILPLDQLYQDRNDSPEATEAWDNFIEYYQAEGGPWLAELDLDEQYTLGWLESDSGR